MSTTINIKSLIDKLIIEKSDKAPDEVKEQVQKALLKALEMPDLGSQKIKIDCKSIATDLLKTPPKRIDHKDGSIEVLERFFHKEHLQHPEELLSSVIHHPKLKQQRLLLKLIFLL